MQIDGYVQALREDLVRVAALGDETTARAAELLAVALESSVARRLQEVLGEAALEVSSQLDSGRVEVRIAGGDPELVVVRDQEAEPAAAGDDILDARITLRLPDALKRRVEDAATKEGVSVNTWIVHAVARNAHAARRSSGKRLTGYGRS
jgi:HicB family